MAELLKSLYEHTEARKETGSVTDFLTHYAKGGEMEERFLEAVHDTRPEGFRDGMKAALQLFSELHGTDTRGRDNERGGICGPACSRQRTCTDGERQSAEAAGRGAHIAGVVRRWRILPRNLIQWRDFY